MPEPGKYSWNKVGFVFFSLFIAPTIMGSGCDANNFVPQPSGPAATVSVNYLSIIEGGDQQLGITVTLDKAPDPGVVVTVKLKYSTGEGYAKMPYDFYWYGGESPPNLETFTFVYPSINQIKYAHAAADQFTPEHGGVEIPPEIIEIEIDSVTNGYVYPVQKPTVLIFDISPGIAAEKGGLVVSTASGNTTEDGGTATFTVQLLGTQFNPVTIPVSTSNGSEGTASTELLTFPGANNTPQTVVVTGINDDDIDGDIGYTIELGLMTSVDPRYDGLDPPDVPFINEDND